MTQRLCMLIAMIALAGCATSPQVGLTRATAVQGDQTKPVPSTPSQARMTHHSFKTSDGIRLHYIEATSPTADLRHTLVMIPGWIMPARIFDAQLAELSRHFRVLALDPRSHGESDIAKTGHDPIRRTRDIAEFLKAAQVKDFILAGWSLGVLESLDYVERYRPRGLKALILIDNSVGEGKPPTYRSSNFAQTMNDPASREVYMRQFSKDIFKTPAPPEIAQAVVDSALRAPPKAAIQLLNQPYPRTHWKELLEKQHIPVLYAITPRYADQAEALQAKRPPEQLSVVIFEDAGHALFVDQSELFNSAVTAFSLKVFVGDMPARSPSQSTPSR